MNIFIPVLFCFVSFRSFTNSFPSFRHHYCLYLKVKIGKVFEVFSFKNVSWDPPATNLFLFVISLELSSGGGV